jgi:formylglycine-generating enzyme required for sulfatase activity
MSAQIADRLRTLAHEHHEGRLDLASYRALRGPLLDSLSSGASSPPIEITEPRVAHRQMQRDAITRPGRPYIATSAEPEGGATARGTEPELGAELRVAGAAPQGPGWIPMPGRTRLSGARKRLVVWTAAAMLAVAAGAVWIWMQHRKDGPAGADSGANTAAAEPGAARNAVEQFMEGSDWSDGRLAVLNASLMEVGGEQIAPLTREAGFQRFVDELRRRIKEQQALSPTTLTVNNSPLAALAVTVGLDLNSPDSALHISAAPSVRGAENAADARHAEPRVALPETGERSIASNTATTAVAPPKQASSGPTPELAKDVGPTAGTAAEDPASATARTAATIPASTTAVDIRTPDHCRRESIHTRRPLCQDPLPSGSDAPMLALVPAGDFVMGSTEAPEEQPVHHVTIGDAFAISVYEISQGEFRQYCEALHRQCSTQPWSGDDYPVVNVSWQDARGYVDWLSSVTHHRYGLPTEAQWEYAARAGNTGPFPSGTALSPTDANFAIMKKLTIAAPRSQKFNPNAFKLVHTVGNVREWVEDPWSQTYAGAPNDGSSLKSAGAAMRVARGGSYMDGSARLRLSMREGLAPDTRDATTGFRIVRELQ